MSATSNEFRHPPAFTLNQRVQKPLFTGSILRPSYTIFCLTAMATALIRSFV